MDTIEVAGISAISALLTTVVNYIVGPYVLWRIEKRKKQFDYKCELIRKWRQMIENVARCRDNDVDQEEQGHGLMFYLERNSDFWSLHPHLSPDVRKSLHGRVATHAPDGSTIDGKLFRLADEISRIEKEWGVIADPVS